LTETPPKHLFWDSCVLIRYLTGIPAGDEGVLNALVDEAKAGKVKIWHSTLLYTEVRPSQLAAAGYDQMQDLVDDLAGAMFPIGPTPSILMRAGRIRDYAYLHHSPQKDEKTRVLTVPDSVHLCTCLHVLEDRGVSDIVFCTYDDGKGRNYEEKAVSLLRFEEYAQQHIGDLDVLAVCELTRQKPWHPQPSFV
jgi:hypothetical protein